MYVKNYDDVDDKMNVSHWSLPSTVSEETSLTNVSSPAAGLSTSTIPRAVLTDAAAKREREQTLVTITSGRGYINYQDPCCNKNENNAHIVIWELKL